MACIVLLILFEEFDLFYLIIVQIKKYPAFKKVGVF